jgi:hypothetical protein
VDLAIGQQHLVGVAVVVAAGPHLLDLRVPHDGVAGQPPIHLQVVAVDDEVTQLSSPSGVCSLGRDSASHQPWNSSHCTYTDAFGNAGRLLPWSKCMWVRNTFSMSAGATPTRMESL